MGYNLLETITLDGSSTQVEFTNIPSEAEAIVIQYEATHTSTSDDNLYLRYNNNSNSVYDTQFVRNRQNTTPQSYTGSGLTHGFLASAVGYSTDTGTLAASGEIYISSPKSTEKKAARYDCARENYSNTNNEFGVAMGGIVSNSTDPITSIQLFTTHNMVAGSNFSIYAIF